MKVCKIPQLNKNTILKDINPLIDNWDINDIDSRIQDKLPHSLKWLPIEFVENGTQSYIDGSPESKIISQFRLGKGRLKNREGSLIKQCPFCQADIQMTEAHVVMSCRQLNVMREECGITDWCIKNGLVNHTDDEKLRQYLGDDGAVSFVLNKRGNALIKMREKFLSEIQRIHEMEMNSLNELELWERANIDLSAPTPVFGQDHPIWDSWTTIVESTS